MLSSLFGAERGRLALPKCPRSPTKSLRMALFVSRSSHEPPIKRAFSPSKQKREKSKKCFLLFLAQREGFEPPDSFPSTVFKTAAIDHSTISAYINFYKTSRQRFDARFCSRFRRLRLLTRPSRYDCFATIASFSFTILLY